MKKTNIFFLCFVLLGISPLIGQGSSEEKMIVQEHQEIAAPASLAPEAVSVSDYCQFLNAVAAKDSKSFYDQTLGAHIRKECLMRSGLPGDYSYSVIPGKEEMPMSLVNREEIAQYGYWKQDAFSVVVFEGSREVTETIDPLLKSNQLTFQVIATNTFAYQASGAGVAGMLSDDIMNALFSFTLGAAALAAGENTSALREESDSRKSKEALPPRAAAIGSSSGPLEKSAALTTIRGRQEHQGGEEYRLSSLPLMVLGTTLRTLPVIITRRFHSFLLRKSGSPMAAALGLNLDSDSMYAHSHRPTSSPVLPHQPSRFLRHESHEIFGLKRRISTLSMMSMRPWMKMTSPRLGPIAMLQTKKKEQGGEHSDSFRISERLNPLGAFCEGDFGKEKIKLLDEAIEKAVEHKERQRAFIEAQEEALKIAPDEEAKKSMEETIKSSRYLEASIASKILSLEANQFKAIVSLAVDNAMRVAGEEKIKFWNEAIQKAKEQKEKQRAFIKAQEEAREIAPDEEAKESMEGAMKHSRYFEARIASKIFGLEANQLHATVSLAIDKTKLAIGEERIQFWSEAIKKALEHKEKQRAFIKAQEEAWKLAPDNEAKKAMEEAMKSSRYVEASIAYKILSLEADQLDAAVSFASDEAIKATGEEKIQLWNKAISKAKEQQKKQRASIKAQEEAWKIAPDEEVKGKMEQVMKRSRYLEAIVVVRILTMKVYQLDDTVSLVCDKAKLAIGEEKIKFLNEAIGKAVECKEKQHASIKAQEEAWKIAPDEEAKEKMEQVMKHFRYLEARIASKVLALEANQLDDAVSFASDEAIKATGEEKIQLWNKAISKAKEQKEKQRAFIKAQQEALDVAPDEKAKESMGEAMKSSRYLEARIASNILALESNQLDAAVSLTIDKANLAIGEEKIKFWGEATEKAVEHKEKQRAFIKAQEEAWKIAPNEEAKESMEDALKRSRYLEASIAAKILSLEAEQLDAAVSFASDEAIKATGEEKIQLWNKAISKAKEQQKKQRAFIEAQEEVLKVAPDEEVKKLIEEGIKHSYYAEAMIAAKILSLEAEQLNDAVSLPIEKSMSATGEEKVNLCDEAIQKVVELKEMLSVFIKSLKKALKIAPNEEAKKSMEEAINKESCYLEAAVASQIFQIKAMKADEIALINRDNSMVANNAAQAWADYANVLVEEADKKEKEEANYTSARWAAASLLILKEAEIIDKTILSRISSKDVKDSSQNDGSEWVQKFIKAQQCKEVMHKLYGFSHNLKDTDPIWEERSKEDEARYKKWENICNVIEKEIDVYKTTDEAAAQQKWVKAKEREAFYAKLCKQCSQSARSIDRAIIDFVTSFVPAGFISADYLPPVVINIINFIKNNIAFSEHVIDYFCQDYLRGGIIDVLEKEREKRSRLFQEKETATKVRNSLYLKLKYSPEFNAIGSIPTLQKNTSLIPLKNDYKRTLLTNSKQA